MSTGCSGPRLRQLSQYSPLHSVAVGPESSNVDMIREMSTMMTAERALQSAAQVLKLYDGLLTKAANELARM